MENWLGSSLDQIQVWTNVRESYYHALEQGPLSKGRVTLVRCLLFASLRRRTAEYIP